jgi:hypothetical protein
MTRIPSFVLSTYKLMSGELKILRSIMLMNSAMNRHKTSETMGMKEQARLKSQFVILELE